MSAIDTISKYFYSELYKKNVHLFLEKLLPSDGSILNHRSVKGEVQSSSDGGFWKVSPEEIWDIECKLTKKKYRLHFIVKSGFLGDITLFWAGNAYYKILDEINENALKSAISEVLKNSDSFTIK